MCDVIYIKNTKKTSKNLEQHFQEVAKNEQKLRESEDFSMPFLPIVFPKSIHTRVKKINWLEKPYTVNHIAGKTFIAIKHEIFIVNSRVWIFY